MLTILEKAHEAFVRIRRDNLCRGVEIGDGINSGRLTRSRLLPGVSTTIRSSSVVIRCVPSDKESMAKARVETASHLVLGPISSADTFLFHRSGNLHQSR